MNGCGGGIRDSEKKTSIDTKKGYAQNFSRTLSKKKEQRTERKKGRKREEDYLNKKRNEKKVFKKMLNLET